MYVADVRWAVAVVEQVGFGPSGCRTGASICRCIGTGSAAGTGTGTLAYRELFLAPRQIVPNRFDCQSSSFHGLIFRPKAFASAGVRVAMMWTSVVKSLIRRAFAGIMYFSAVPYDAPLCSNGAS